jgi:hypothetical protein
MIAITTKAPMRFPLTEGDIRLFCHPAEEHQYASPHMIEGNLCAGNGHIAIRATSGRWMESDFTAPSPDFAQRIGSLPWAAIPGDSPEWRSMDEIRGTIYRFAPISIWTEKGKRSPSPIVSIGGHHLIRLSHLQLIARLPRCEAYAGATTRHAPLFFRYNGGTVIVPTDKALTTASFGIFHPRTHALTGERVARTTTRQTINGGHLKGWPPAEPID